MTAAYAGPPQPAGLWFPLEFLPLGVLPVRLLRRALPRARRSGPPPSAAAAGVCAALARTAWRQARR
ncbi:hypothetical protein [Dactylosporangium sp. CA-092794]|uniref:hypothetical protein n=1 Tax=Dactylosporangium sp. CA-092794 TaxID=3239929 RepID=UPI003D8C58AD